MGLDSVSNDRTSGVDHSSGVDTSTGVGTDMDLATALDQEVDAINQAAVAAEAGATVQGTDEADTVASTSSHTVQRGDTLSHIARDHGVPLSDLIAANPQIADPDKIYPGDQVTIPAGGTGPGAGVPAAGDIAGLQRGARGQHVADLQTQLNALGYNSGPVDGEYGPITQAAVRSLQYSNDLPTTGQVDDATQALLESGNANGPRPYEAGDVPNLEQYTPGSPEQIALFREAARAAGLPEEWASDPGLINILRRESNGRVGVPNYTYGARARDPSQWDSVHAELRSGRITARSSATGLGQLLLSNVDRYYPSGRAGIGNPIEEAAGMMNYIQDRYGTPGNAWRLYGTRHEGY